MKNKVVIITGASSGIGEATANLFANNGFKVYGTSRRGSPAQAGDKFEMLPLDVNDDLSVKALVAEVIKREGHIDVLINNAGFGVAGAAEESSIEQSKAIFETNFFGCLRMINEVLPHMRNQKSGRIINLSSALGKIPAPFMALYAATKHALEGYSESLDHEIRTYNIRSILIEPAFTKTNMEQNNIVADKPISSYENARNKIIQLNSKALENGESADVIAKTILKAANDSKPKVRYPAGIEATKLLRLRKLIPDSFFDSAIRKSFQLDK